MARHGINGIRQHPAVTLSAEPTTPYRALLGCTMSCGWTEAGVDIAIVRRKRRARGYAFREGEIEDLTFSQGRAASVSLSSFAMMATASFTRSW